MSERWEMSEAAQALRRQDSRLAPLIDRVGPIELRSRRPYFWALCRAILAQQVSGHAARAIQSRFRALFPKTRHPTPAAVLVTPTERLRSVGVSRQKASYLHALAAEFSRGRLSGVRFSKLSDEQVVDRLTSVPGVGRWTAEMFLIFSLRRPDVFPLDDLGIRRGMERFFDVSERDAQLERADPWRPFRTVASLYLWRAQEAIPA